jgi:hypothetical protein
MSDPPRQLEAHEKQSERTHDDNAGGLACVDDLASRLPAYVFLRALAAVSLALFGLGFMIVHSYLLQFGSSDFSLQSFAVVGECCGLRNRPQSAPTRSAMASAEKPAGLRTAKFRRYTLSFDNVL